MRLRSLLTSVAATALCGAMLLTSACSSTKAADNTSEIKVVGGDILAEMTILIGEETGKIRFKLFPEVAPRGVDNFVKLAESGYYDGKTIHRVIKDFMIQGGSLQGNGIGGTTANKTELPRETNDRMRAYYGALGYAEDSEGINSQFFIINNNTPFDIDKTAENIAADLEEYGNRLSEEDKNTYTEYLNSLKATPDDVKAKYLSSGGTFTIDGNYTIFGQAIEGFDVIEKISEVEVASGNKLDDEQGIDSKPAVSIVIKKIEIARIPVIEETAAATTTRRTLRPQSTTTVQSADSTASNAIGDSTQTAPESVAE